MILVYGERGPVMTWEERAEAGVPAKISDSAAPVSSANRFAKQDDNLAFTSTKRPDRASARSCILGLRSLGALAKNPFAHVGRASNQFNPNVFAANQKPNHPEVHQGDLAKIQNCTLAAIVHY